MKLSLGQVCEMFYVLNGFITFVIKICQIFPFEM